MSDILFKLDNGVATITLNRPKSLNAFSMNMIKSWISMLEKVRDSEDVKVLVLTGNGRAFCAGGDLKTMMAGEGFINQNNEEENVDLTSTGLARKNSLWKYIQKIPLLLQEIDKPVIAAINGDAIGAGLDMALMCDMRFASDKARMGEGYINAGLVPGDGGAYFLPRIINVDKALEMLWTGKILTAAEAKEIGLVTKVYPHELLMEEVYQFCDELTQKPQVALRMIKRSLYQGLNMDLRTSLDLISSHMAIVTELDDFKERTKSILD